MDFLELAKKRYSTRQFQNKKVEKQKIEAIINNDKNKNNGQALLYQELDSIQEKNIL